MNELGQYKEKNKLTDEQLAKLLSDKLGRSISVKGVAQQLGRESPSVPWLNALGISPKEPIGLKDKKVESGVNPAGISPPAIALPFEIHTAEKTIEMIYAMAGKGAAMASRTPEVAVAWEQSAPSLAAGWIEWAKENRTVANGIAMLTVGGPGGQVILMNASLLITTLMLVQRQRGIQLVPPGFNIYEGMSDEQIREQTEQNVDEQLRRPTPPSD
jgi:hypothetical protein